MRRRRGTPGPRRPRRTPSSIGVHQRGVERVGDAQPRGLAAAVRDSAAAMSSDERPRRRRPPRTRGPLTAAMLTPVRQRAAGDLRLGGLDRDHRAAGRQRLHQPAARGDQRARVRQRQHAGHVRGGELADRVAEQQVRASAPGLEQPEQRDLDGEQGGLGVPGLVQQRPAPARRSPRAAAASSRSGEAGTPRRTPRRRPGTRAYSSLPMPARWAPWPENRNASGRSSATLLAARRARSRRRPSASRPRQPASAGPAPRHGRAVLKRRRVVASERADVGRSRLGAGRARCGAGAAGLGPQRLLRCRGRDQARQAVGQAAATPVAASACLVRRSSAAPALPRG